MPDHARTLTRHPSPDDKIPIAEAARIISVHVETMRKYVADGKITGYKLAGGSNIRIRRGDLDQLLAPMVTTGTLADDR